MATRKDYIRSTSKIYKDLATQDRDLLLKWYQRNKAVLDKAYSELNLDEYRKFANTLYKRQIWESLEPEKFQQGFNPTVALIRGHFNRLNKEIDFELKYAPDIDEKGNFIPNPNGYTPVQWALYLSLDDTGKDEFKKLVKTLNQLEEEAKTLTLANREYKKRRNFAIMAPDPTSSATALLGEILAGDPAYAPDASKTIEASKEQRESANQRNEERLQQIQSRNLERMMKSPKYQKSYKWIREKMGKQWDQLAKTDQGKEQLNQVFENAIKWDPNTGQGNRVLEEASGINAKDKVFQQYQTLMKENPQFKLDYLAHALALASLEKNGKISPGLRILALEDYASRAMKEKETWDTRTGNNLKGAWNTAVNHTLRKAAVFKGMFQEGGDVYTDGNGNVYAFEEVGREKDGKTYIYIDEDGEPVDIRAHGDKIQGGGIYKKNGMYSKTGSEDAEHHSLRKIPVFKEKMTGMDLARLGKDNRGHDVEGILNERYLSLSDKYNDYAWNRENLDYFNKYGISKYNNIVMPGTDGRDFWAELTRMSGFIIADLVPSLALRGAGAAVGGLPNIVNTGLQIAGGTASAMAIGDAYAQGVFEEGLERNKQAIYENIANKALALSLELLDSPKGKKLFDQALEANVKAWKEETGNKEVSEPILLELKHATRQLLLDLLTESKLQELMLDPSTAGLLAKAVKSAGDAALTDLIGESLKYTLVNTLMFRKWMFKTRNVEQEAMRATEKELFGKNLNRIKYATAEDVKRGLASKEGEAFVAKAWKDMTKALKAGRVLGVTGLQFWGGAWTNWTDEMQSAGTGAVNDVLFNSELNGDEGGYLAANILAAHTGAVLDSIFKPTSLWAGLIGGSGGIFGVMPNVGGMLSLLTKEGRRQHAQNVENMGKVPAFLNLMFQNSVLSETSLLAANDARAVETVDRMNKLVDSFSGENFAQLASLMTLVNNIGTSFNPVESKENDIIQVYNMLQSAAAFSRSNPGLAELEYTNVIKEFQEKLQRYSNQKTKEDTDDLISEIQAQNSGITKEQAANELANVRDRANIMLDAISRFQKLQESKEYKAALKHADKHRDKIKDLENKVLLKALYEYQESALEERESVLGLKVNPETNNDIATYGSTHAAVKSQIASYDLLQDHYRNAKRLIEGRKKAMGLDKKIAEAEKKLEELVEKRKQDLLNGGRNIKSIEGELDYWTSRLQDLYRDNDYLLGNLDLYDRDIERAKKEHKRLRDAAEEAFLQDLTSLHLYTAEEILKMNPIDRFRMLNPNNLDNYNTEQQAEINKAISMMNDKGFTLEDVRNQAIGFARNQRRAELMDQSPSSFSIETLIHNMIEAAELRQWLKAVDTLKEDLAKIETDNASFDKEIIDTLKKVHLVSFSSGMLEYAMKSSEFKDTEEQGLMEEALETVRMREQMRDLAQSKLLSVKLDKQALKAMEDILNNLSLRNPSPKEFQEALEQKASNENLVSLAELLDLYSSLLETENATTLVDETESHTEDSASRTDINVDAEVDKIPDAEHPLPDTEQEQHLNLALKRTLSALRLKIAQTQEGVVPASQIDPHSPYHIVKGKQFLRVHSLMGNSFLNLSLRTGSERSLFNGRTVDGLVRGYFNGAHIEKPEHWSQEAYDKLIGTLDEIRDRLEERGEVFLANNIVVYHEFPNGVRVAGELDILSVKINEDGTYKFNIYDLKTSAGDKRGGEQTGDAFTFSKYWETNESPTRWSIQGIKEQYTNQVSMYDLLYSRMIGAKVDQLALLPYMLWYDKQDRVTDIEKHKGIPLQYDPIVEKIIAYYPVILKAMETIQKDFQGVFTPEQLQVIQDIMVNGISKGVSFSNDMKNFFQLNSGLDAEMSKEGRVQRLNEIVKEAVQEAREIDVKAALEEQIKPLDIEEAPAQEPAPLPVEDATPGENTAPANAESLHNDIAEPGVISIPLTNETEREPNMTIAPDGTLFIKGNVMDMYDYGSKLKGVLVRKYTSGEGRSMDLFYRWMESRGINLPEIVDLELNDIMATGTTESPVQIRFLKVNDVPGALHNEYMKNHTLLAVKYTDAIKKIHNEELGKPVETQDGEYLIIGVSGFVRGNQEQYLQHRRIASTVDRNARNYFNSVSTYKEFYVEPSMYTHVALTHSGYLITRMLGDTKQRLRDLSELIADKDRNPHRFTLDNLIFGILTARDFEIIRGKQDTNYIGPLNLAANIGNVFVLVPSGIDGSYKCAMITPLRYNEIREGSELETMLLNAARKLASPIYSNRAEARLTLADLLVLHRAEQKQNEGIDIIPGGPDYHYVTIKKDGITLMHRPANTPGLMQEILNALQRANPRVSVTRNHLLDSTRVRILDKAGALLTDLARLAKSGGDYSVYNVGEDGKPLIPKELHREVNIPESFTRTERVVYLEGNSYYEQAPGNFIDRSTGNTVTDPELIQSLNLNQTVNRCGGTPYTPDANTEYFILDNSLESPRVIKRDTTSNRCSELDYNEATSIIEKVKELNSRQAQEERDAAAKAALKGTPRQEEPVVLDPGKAPEDEGGSTFEELRRAALEQGRQPKKNTNSSPTKKKSPTKQSTTEDKKNILRNLDNSGKGSNFATYSAMELLLDETTSEKVYDAILKQWPEAEQFEDYSQIVDFLKSKGKMVKGIKDVDAWIDNFKC